MSIALSAKTTQQTIGGLQNGNNRIKDLSKLRNADAGGSIRDQSGRQ